MAGSTATNMTPVITGRYRVLSVLGQGGMGIAYRAWDHVEEMPVVIKMPVSGSGPELEANERFRRECVKMTTLVHPSIVPVLDEGADESGRPFIVLRFLPGGALADRIRRTSDGEPLPSEPTGLHDWLPRIAEALDFMHAKGVVHRDVKPANIFFDARNQAFLGDFGIAKSFEYASLDDKQATLTATNMAIGSHAYMSPELFQPKPALAGTVDQYALAVTVYEFLSGVRPFKGESAHIIIEHVTLPPTPLRTILPRLPQSVSEAVNRALEKKPSNRFASCQEFSKQVLQEIEPISCAPDTAWVMCPSCRRIIKLTRAFAGKSGKCKRCTATLRVADDLESVWLGGEEITPDRPSSAAELLDTQTAKTCATKKSRSLARYALPLPKATDPWRHIAFLGILGVIAVAVYLALYKTNERGSAGRDLDRVHRALQYSPPHIETALLAEEARKSDTPHGKLIAPKKEGVSSEHRQLAETQLPIPSTSRSAFHSKAETDSPMSSSRDPASSDGNDSPAPVLEVIHGPTDISQPRRAWNSFAALVQQEALRERIRTWSNTTQPVILVDGILNPDAIEWHKVNVEMGRLGTDWSPRAERVTYRPEWFLRGLPQDNSKIWAKIRVAKDMNGLGQLVYEAEPDAQWVCGYVPFVFVHSGLGYRSTVPLTFTTTPTRLPWLPGVGENTAYTLRAPGTELLMQIGCVPTVGISNKSVGAGSLRALGEVVASDGGTFVATLEDAAGPLHGEIDWEFINDASMLTMALQVREVEKSPYTEALGKPVGQDTVLSASEWVEIVRTVLQKKLLLSERLLGARGELEKRIGVMPVNNRSKQEAILQALELEVSNRDKDMQNIIGQGKPALEFQADTALQKAKAREAEQRERILQSTKEYEEWSPWVDAEAVSGAGLQRREVRQSVKEWLGSAAEFVSVGRDRFFFRSCGAPTPKDVREVASNAEFVKGFLARHGEWTNGVLKSLSEGGAEKGEQNELFALVVLGHLEEVFNSGTQHAAFCSLFLEQAPAVCEVSLHILVTAPGSSNPARTLVAVIGSGVSREREGEQSTAGATLGSFVDQLTSESLVTRRAEGEVITNSLGMRLRLVPAGTFTMGHVSSPSNVSNRMHRTRADEVALGQAHRVTLTSPFYIGVHEVTNAQWSALMGSVPSNCTNGDHPVEQVLWEEAVDFCRRLSALPGERQANRVSRLPTEAEWEYACRAGSTTRYSFGEDDFSLSEYAWHQGNSANRTFPVGGKKPNAWGLFDMHGNVYEWCADWYGNLGTAPVINPAGAKSGVFKVIRGGSWNFPINDCRSSFRRGNDPAVRGSGLGFRVVCDIYRN